MADYEFRYQLQAAPQPVADGSSGVIHGIDAVCRVAGSADPFRLVPGRHVEIVVPAAEMKAMSDLPDGTSAQRTAKANAYKGSLAARLGRTLEPRTGWTAAELEAAMDANDAAALEAGRADTFIRSRLGLTYPVTFSM